MLGAWRQLWVLSGERPRVGLGHPGRRGFDVRLELGLRDQLGLARRKGKLLATLASHREALGI